MEELNDKKLTESEILAKVLRELSGGPVRLFRNQVGRYKIGNRWITYGLTPGSSDIIGFKSVTITPDMIGKTFAVIAAIEIKKPSGKPKENQQKFIEFIRKFGGFAGVARSSEDARKILEIND